MSSNEKNDVSLFCIDIFFIIEIGLEFDFFYDLIECEMKWNKAVKRC